MDLLYTFFVLQQIHNNNNYYYYYYRLTALDFVGDYPRVSGYQKG